MVLLNLQAVQNRLYNDHAALYYLLLSKWEKGKLSVPHSNPLIPHPRLSVSGVPPSIPHINIHSLDCKTSAGHLPSSAAPPLVQGAFQVAGLAATGANLEGEGGSDEMIRDPNLDRYLKHGRRHTLGAAQNHILVNPEDLKR